MIRFVTFLGLLPLSALACLPHPAHVLETDFGNIHINFEPDVLKVAQPFSVRASLCHAEKTTMLERIDAWMPAHNHGMNYLPSLSQSSTGVYHAKGFFFHMPGQWQFKFESRLGDNQQTFTLDVEIN